MSDIQEVSEYTMAYAESFAGEIERLEREAIRLNAPHILAQADQLRAAIDDARDTSLRMLGAIPNPMGPDCRDGKHPACDGRAWNNTTDAPAVCGCACHEEE